MTEQCQRCGFPGGDWDQHSDYILTSIYILNNSTAIHSLVDHLVETSEV